MKVMYTEALKLFKNTLAVDCKIFQLFNSVKLLDSTHITLPDSMEEKYKGCSAGYKDRSKKVKSAVKLQVIFDYLKQSLDRVEITEGIRSDQGYRTYLSDISAGDLLIADLGYFVPSSFSQIIESRAYFISRYKTDTNIYSIVNNEKLDLLKLLDNQLFLSLEVLLGKEAQVRARIICYKLTEGQSASRRRKANKLAKSHGYTSSRKNQKLLDWSVFITNIPENMVSAEHILKICRVRWQIELLFKLYKSHIKIEELKGKNKSSRIMCELYAKLCAMLIFHGISSCNQLKSEKEISLTKAFVELRRRSRELFLLLKKKTNYLVEFFKKLIIA